jgi:hypothetical protein
MWPRHSLKEREMKERGYKRNADDVEEFSKLMIYYY